VPSTNADSALLTEFADIFSGKGEFPGEHHSSIDPSVKPVIHAPRRVALAIARPDGQNRRPHQARRTNRLGVNPLAIW